MHMQNISSQVFAMQFFFIVVVESNGFLKFLISDTQMYNQDQFAMMCNNIQ